MSNLENKFKFHPAETKDIQNQHEIVRAKCLDLALQLDYLLIECREKSLAMTKLEEVMFWANAAVARHQ